MTCPYAHPTRGNGRCGGAGVLAHRSQWIPCPSCWMAAGRPALSMLQTTTLRRYHVLMLEVAGLGTDEPDRLAAACRNFDSACSELDRLGVIPDIRHAWVAWVEAHAGVEAMKGLRAAVLSQPARA